MAQSFQCCNQTSISQEAIDQLNLANNNSISIPSCHKCSSYRPFSPSSVNSSGYVSAVDSEQADNEKRTFFRSISLSNEDYPLNATAPSFSQSTVSLNFTPGISKSGWEKIRSIVYFMSPFLQKSVITKGHSYPWIQISGHEGNFCSSDSGFICKKYDPIEEYCYLALTNNPTDPINAFIPKFSGITQLNGKKFLKIEDLQAKFVNPNIMDIKMGTRTFLESTCSDSKLRPDLYKKMIEIDPSAPTPEEVKKGAIDKLRYMVFRESLSSTSTLGFRIEGMIDKSKGEQSKDFKCTKTALDVAKVFQSFINDNHILQNNYLNKLKQLRDVLRQSPFFKKHELIGSSLLFLHNSDDQFGVWMIDFAKTNAVDSDTSIDHSIEWKYGNHEDGYLFGLENLIKILEVFN